jgi:large subunit ribosomal protein L29
MKRKDIRQLNDVELDKLRHDTTEELGKLPFQKATGQMENVHLIREKRRLLARVLTLQNERVNTPAVQGGKK